MRHTMSWAQKLFFLGVVLLLAAAAPLASGLHSRPAAAQDGQGNLPPEVESSLAQWPLPNKDYSNTRATTDSSITSANVGQLGIGWTFQIPGGSDYGASATNPIIAGDVVYFQDLASNVYAMNLSDGTLLWNHNYDAGTIGPNGVSVGWGKVFVPVDGDRVSALDMKTGDELWSTNVRTQNESEGITIQTMPYGGLVYLSTVPGSTSEDFYAGGVGGIIYALDQETGEIKWQFNTIQDENLWGNSEINSGGGSWYVPAIDQDSNNMFWSVANPAPWPGTPDFPNGTSRPGDNLYTNSLVTLNAENGGLQWYQQVLPHDLFDQDLQISPILATAVINGTERQIVMTSGKLGVVYAFDRATGEMLWQRPVGLHLNDGVKEIPEGMRIEVMPGPLGGVETPMAYADGVLFVPVVDLSGFYTSTQFDGSTFTFDRARGELVAIDVNTGFILWTKQYNTMNIGAATVVNDVVFTATMDGMIYAYNRTTGDQIWSYQAPNGINGWPAVSGDTILWPAGLGGNPVMIALRVGASQEGMQIGGPEATEQPQQTEGQDQQGQGEGQTTTEMEAGATEAPNAQATEQPSAEGTEQPQAQGTEQPQATEQANAQATEQAGQGQGGGQDQTAQGEQLVQERCTACHTLERVDNADYDEQGWTSVVHRMIGYGAQLNDQEAEAVIAYLTATH